MRARRQILSDLKRCPNCRLHRTLCLCALVPQIETRTRVVLVMHDLELRKPTNTGSLAARCLPNSSVLVRGRLDGTHALPELAAHYPASSTALLLFPHQDAVPLDQWSGPKENLTLVVPDGTWRQAAHARRRIVGLDAVPCVCLPQTSPPSLYRLRTAARPGRVSTMEAIARALGILEGPGVEEALLHIHRIMVDRTLWTNGRIATEDVTGGIPEGVQSHDPLAARSTPADS